ncbi:MAG: hypothetical protein ACTSSJ_05975 [Candidatus Odinarchaeia archaeon]
MKNKKLKLKKDSRAPLTKDNLTAIRKVITLLDGYIINKFKDPTKIGKSVESGEAGIKIKRNWGKIWGVLCDLTRLTSKIPKAVKYLKLFNLINLSAAAIFSLSVVLFMLHFTLNIPWIIGGIFLISALSFILLARSYLMRKIALSIEEYASTHKDEFEDKRLFLKNFVQELIFDLRDYFRRSKLNPRDYPFHIYNLEYKGIEVTKKPGILRKASIAIVKLT